MKGISLLCGMGAISGAEGAFIGGLQSTASYSSASCSKQQNTAIAGCRVNGLGMIRQPRVSSRLVGGVLRHPPMSMLCSPRREGGGSPLSQSQTHGLSSVRLNAWLANSMSGNTEEVKNSANRRAEDSLDDRLAKTTAVLSQVRDTLHWVKANKRFDRCEVLEALKKCQRLVSRVEHLLKQAQRSGDIGKCMQKIDQHLAHYRESLGLNALQGKFYARGQLFDAMSEDMLYGDKLITEFAERTTRLGDAPCGTRRKMNAQRYAEILGFFMLKKFEKYAVLMQTPYGDWSEDCRIDYWDGKTLEATCQDSRGDDIASAIETNRLDKLMNDEGYLKHDFN